MGLIDAFRSMGDTDGEALGVEGIRMRESGGIRMRESEGKTSREYMDEVMDFCENVDAMTPGQRCFIAGYLQALEDMAAKTTN